jgi:hypothetical protein
METKRNSENNEDAHLKLALEEFISEQKTQTKSISDLTGAINSLSDRFINVEEELRKSKPISVSTNMQPIQEIIKKSISDIKVVIATEEQKPIVKKYQLLLFPEQDARLFYKIVFGRWFLWLVVMLFLTNLYKFAVHLADKQSEVKMKTLGNDRINKSWNYLYLKSDKGIKKIMENAYSHSDEH